MAAVNFTGSQDTGRGGKLKGGIEVKAQLRHNDMEERLKRDHFNKHIDKSLTPNNYSIYGTSYSEACRRYDERIKAIDSAVDDKGVRINKNRRKDRVTCFCLEMTRPEGLTPEESKRWFWDVARIIRQQYGTKNFIEGYIHVDEVHPYYDTRKGKTLYSREHMHAMVVPEHEGRLNGKWFSSPSNMVKLNEQIEKMTVERYGCHFMTGEKFNGKSVERLKEASESTWALMQAENALQEREAACEAREERCSEREAQSSRREAECEEREVRCRKREKACDVRERSRTELEERNVKALEDAAAAYSSAAARLQNDEGLEAFCKGHKLKRKQKDGTVVPVSVYDAYKIYVDDVHRKNSAALQQKAGRALQGVPQRRMYGGRALPDAPEAPSGSSGIEFQ